MTARVPWVLALALLGAPLATGAAQERLITRHALGMGATLESVGFGDDGVLQTAFAGIDSVRLSSARQLSLPITGITPLGLGWRLDVTALYASGDVTFREAAGARREYTVSLAGVSDVRLRATGAMWGDAITLTVGANVPTGTTTLTGDEFSALRVLASPALGLGSTPVGSGPSGTVGAVMSRMAGPWSVAFGASYEHRGRFQPVAALIAGAPSANYRPGGVVRTSVGLERLVGSHRLALAGAVDIFANDRLHGVPPGGASGSSASTLATVRMGPVLTADAQFLIAAPRVRELILYSSYYWRAPYARDGRTMEGSSGQYVGGGVRTSVPLHPRADLFVAADGRWHSGLAVNEGLPTAGVRAGSVTTGLSVRRSFFTLQPFLRVQGGSLRQRESGSLGTFTGVSSGLVLISRW